MPIKNQFMQRIPNQLIVLTTQRSSSENDPPLPIVAITAMISIDECMHVAPQ